MLDASSTAPMNIPLLDLSSEIDTLWDELNAATQRVLRSGVFAGGPEVQAFENEVASYLGVEHAVGLNSGTDALIIALRALDIGPGDEVVTTPFSFFATAESISMVGARPVFVDIEAESFNLNPENIAKAITERTKAIMPVHLFGRPADMNTVLEIAEQHHLKVIEDCAQAFGARFHGQYVGTLGDAGAFSFYPSKNLGAYGDGGLLTTDDAALADSARMLRNHGSRRGYENERLGYNSRLDALQAAILGVKLPHLESWNQARRRAAQHYSAFLAECEGVLTPELPEGHVMHQYTLRITDGRREWVRDALDKQGISSAVYYPTPLHQLPVYQGQYPEQPVSERLAGEVLSLPLWPGMPEATQKVVAEAIMGTLQGSR